MKKILSIALVGLLACGGWLLTGCGLVKRKPTPGCRRQKQVAFVYVSSRQRRRLLLRHELGRQYVEKHAVPASYIESGS